MKNGYSVQCAACERSITHMCTRADEGVQKSGISRAFSTVMFSIILLAFLVISHDFLTEYKKENMLRDIAVKSREVEVHYGACRDNAESDEELRECYNILIQ